MENVCTLGGQFTSFCPTVLKKINSAFPDREFYEYVTQQTNIYMSSF